MEINGVLLCELSSHFADELKTVAIECNLSVNQVKVLLSVGVYDKNVLTQKDIAKICVTDTPAMSRTIDKLEELGFIERTRSVEDSRCVKIALTDEGEKQRVILLERASEAFNKIFYRLTEKEKKTLVALLVKASSGNDVIGEFMKNMN